MKTILHCDLNNFFASVECVMHPEYVGKPVAVAGNPEERKGVVLAKNYLAKGMGVTTGMTIAEAQAKCPDIIITRVHFDLYNYYSERVREIYLRYTNLVEPFSIDECWLDVTESLKIFGSGEKIADRIRAEVKEETGLTISVGVSFSKTLAKLGSDMKKPDATTVLTPENYKSKIYSLPVGDVVGIGRKTRDKMNKLGIFTLGDLARYDDRVLKRYFGKVGTDLFDVVNGWENTPVLDYDRFPPPKSVGNSTTFYRDIVRDNEVRAGFGVLAESVASRMHAQKIFGANLLHVTVKDSDLHFWGKTIRLNEPTADSTKIANSAMDVYKTYYNGIPSIRLLGISMSDFEKDSHQIGMTELLSRTSVDDTIDRLRAKYGTEVIVKANNYVDKRLVQSLGKVPPKKK